MSSDASIAAKAPPRTVITVNITRNGRQIACDKPFVRMQLNDSIRWLSEGKIGFWIVFDHETPLEKHALSEADVQDGCRPLLYGAFKYHIVLDSDRTIRLDPVVVVDPPPDDGTVRTGSGTP